MCLNQDGPVKHLRYIPGAEAVLDYIPEGEWEAVVACDCGDGKRLGDSFGPALRAFRPLLVVDHHISNDNFGDLNLVVPSASSTSELIYDLLDELGIAVSPRVAECLLTGIMADTGGFRYSSTGARTFAICERLVRAGAHPDKIAQNLYGNRRMEAVLLQAEVLRQMKTHAQGKVVELFVDEEMMQRFGASAEDCDNLVEAGRDIAGVLISVSIRRDSGLWRVSMRSKHEDLDVSQVARYFGGGGHRQAAAFRFRRELEELRAPLLKMLCELAETREAAR